MGDASYNIREIRFVTDDDKTDCYVRLEALGDCPFFVDGWHHKEFPTSVPSVQILRAHLHECVLWPNKEPTLPELQRALSADAVPKQPLPLYVKRRDFDGWVLVLEKVDPEFVDFSAYEWTLLGNGPVTILYGSFDPSKASETVQNAKRCLSGRVCADGKMGIVHRNPVQTVDRLDVEAYACFQNRIFSYCLRHIAAADDNPPPPPVEPTSQSPDSAG